MRTKSLILFVHYCQLLICLVMCAPLMLIAADKPVIGYLETVQIGERKISLNAKIDSGADHSSIHVIDAKPYKKNGKNWIRFKVLDNEGRYYLFDKRVVREVYIKRKNQTSQKRAVVIFGMCLAGVFKTVEVNLSNRSNFRQLMLVGRSYLHGYFLIDVSKQYLSTPDCAQAGDTNKTFEKNSIN